MSGSTTYLIDLRDLVRGLVTDVVGIQEIWLFGSRGYRTGSIRSDVDLLVVVPKDRAIARELLRWRDADEAHQPVDIFMSRDPRSAESLVNGSLLHSETPLSEKLDAQLLWTSTEGMSSQPDDLWRQEFRNDVDYKMTVVPTDFTNTLRQLPGQLDRMGLPNTLMGTDWASVALQCAEILSRTVDANSKLHKHASHVKRDTGKTWAESDFQNLFFLALRPWLPDTELEPHVANFGGQKKFADLCCVDAQLLIEVKVVSDASSSASVAKQLNGLREMYQQSIRVQAVVFIVIVKNSAPWDDVKLDSLHTSLSARPVVVTRTIRLP